MHVVVGDINPGLYDMTVVVVYWWMEFAYGCILQGRMPGAMWKSMTKHACEVIIYDGRWL